jgi:uncharacterized protein with HEPN domain
MHKESRAWQLFATDILGEVEQLDSFLDDTKSYDEFKINTLLVYGCVKALENICEATCKMDEEVKNTRPEVDWRGISNMRNLLAHVYFGVDDEEVWETATASEDLPILVNALEQMLLKDYVQNGELGKLKSLLKSRDHIKIDSDMVELAFSRDSLEVASFVIIKNYEQNGLLDNKSSSSPFSLQRELMDAEKFGLLELTDEFHDRVVNGERESLLDENYRAINILCNAEELEEFIDTNPMLQFLEVEINKSNSKKQQIDFEQTL